MSKHKGREPPGDSQKIEVSESNNGNEQVRQDFLIRFGQAHESFRLAEIRALADVFGVEMDIVSYDPEVCSRPFATTDASETGSSGNHKLMGTLTLDPFYYCSTA